MEELKTCQLDADEAIAILARIAHTESKWPGTEDSLAALDMAVNALRRAATGNKPLTLEELRELAEYDETVYAGDGRAWDLYSAPPEIRAKSEHCNIIIDADKIAGGLFLYAYNPKGSD
jgi:hypothetical protein